MGSPLGPLIADVFMHSMEQKLEPHIASQLLYRRYVDDILVITKNSDDASNLAERFNSVHPNLKVTWESETSNKLPFLDVLIERMPNGNAQTSVFHKATWKGQYTHFLSFTPMQHKRTVVKTLVYRAKGMCSPNCLEAELKLIEKVLINNGYPEQFIRYHSKIDLSDGPQNTVEKKQLCISLPYKGQLPFGQVRR